MYKGKNKKYLKQVKTNQTPAAVSVKTSTAAALYGLVWSAASVVASNTTQAVSSAASVATKAVNATLNATAPYVNQAVQAATGGYSIEPGPAHGTAGYVHCWNDTNSNNPREPVPCKLDPGTIVVLSAVGAGLAAAVGVAAWKAGLFSACQSRCSAQAAQQGEATELVSQPADVEAPPASYGYGAMPGQ